MLAEAIADLGQTAVATATVGPIYPFVDDAAVSRGESPAIAEDAEGMVLEMSAFVTVDVQALHPRVTRPTVHARMHALRVSSLLARCRPPMFPPVLTCLLKWPPPARLPRATVMRPPRSCGVYTTAPPSSSRLGRLQGEHLATSMPHVLPSSYRGSYFPQ